MLNKIYEIKDKIDGKIIWAGIILGTIMAPFYDAVLVYATPTPAGNTKMDKAFDFMKGKDNKTFSSATDTAKQTGASFYKFAMVVCIIGLFLSLIFLGVSHATTRNTSKKSENKSHLVSIIEGAVAVFGVGTILTIVKNIADKL